jgi:hypothetical protein
MTFNINRRMGRERDLAVQEEIRSFGSLLLIPSEVYLLEYCCGSRTADEFLPVHGVLR